MAAGHEKKIITFYLVVVFFVFADRWLKWLAFYVLSDKKIPLAGDFLNFSLTKNENIAFSIPLSGWALEATIFALLAAIAAVILLKGRELGRKRLFFVLILFGGMSNLYDRLSYGYVLDYFDFSYFTVFNLADAMITIGASGLFLAALRPVNKKPC